MTVANPLPVHPTVAATIATARDLLRGEDYVPVADCVDTLLDCYNAAVRPQVKSVVEDLLPSFSVGNVRKAEDFSAALDEIQLALQLDAAFDEVSVPDEDFVPDADSASDADSVSDADSGDGGSVLDEPAIPDVVES